MPSDFEVGKKYQSVINGSIIYECVYKSPSEVTKTRLVIVRWTDAEGKVSEGQVFEDHWQYYQEYVEPRREFFNAYKTSIEETVYDGPFKTRDGADEVDARSSDKRYGVLELIHHSDTKVESIFHLFGPGHFVFTGKK